jgi:hypothetical protein
MASDMSTSRCLILILPNPLVARQLPDDKNNFGPRIGVAWDMFNDRKTVVRAGMAYTAESSTARSSMA